MQITRKAKIALILGIVLVVALAAIYLFSLKKTTPPTEQTPTDESDDIFAPGTTKTTYPDSLEDILSPAPSASATASAPAGGSSAARTPVSTVDENNIRTYTVDITPAPNAGPYDWTRTVSKLEITDISQNQIANKSACELLGLSGSWSNVISKISCDTINFFSTNIVAPFMEMSCALTAQNIYYDTGRPVTYKLDGGACLIIDRQ